MNGNDCRKFFSVLVWFLAMECAAVSLGQPISPEMSAEADAMVSAPLIIIGGGLRLDNRDVFERLIAMAGGREHARFVVLPTASAESTGATEFCEKLYHYGVADANAVVLDIREHNAQQATRDPENLRQMRQATAVYLAGGDQRRLVRLLTESDGSDTPLLKEMRALRLRGGLIAGSSAGASAQSETMLAVSGLPDMLIDEGLDALDFGVTKNIMQRGLLLTRGLGFFDDGIIDQHFFQFRGRLSRLTRATAESGLALGFGIDENTALVVDADRRVEVVGSGFVTVLQPGEDRGQDGPLGYRISDVSVSLLSQGDQYDLAERRVIIDPAKLLVTPDQLSYSGNFMLNDISAGGEAPFALLRGLAENRRHVQEAIALRYHGATSHGYRFKFSKRAITKAYEGTREHNTRSSIIDVRMDIWPIANGLNPSHENVPHDLPEGSSANAVTAVAFRGIIPADRDGSFRPDATMSRREFASALARSAHLQAAPDDFVAMADVDIETLEGDEILRVVAAGLIEVDARRAFRPDEPIMPVDAVSGLLKLAQMGRPDWDPTLRVPIETLGASPQKQVRRADVAVLLTEILQLPK